MSALGIRERHRPQKAGANDSIARKSQGVVKRRPGLLGGRLRSSVRNDTIVVMRSQTMDRYWIRGRMLPSKSERSEFPMRVLVTGHRGYIGSVLTSVLRHSRFDVFGLDVGWFNDCEYGRVREETPSFDLDLREIEYTDLLSFDAVVHLAGLSDDAAAMISPQVSRAINVEGTIRLAECCKQANVERFVFASSCSVYGAGASSELTEDGPVNPLSEYAASKLEAEREILRLADSSFSPTIFRAGTVFGISPSLRVDLAINDFVASAMTTGRVQLNSSGQAMRPFVHVEDIARVYAIALSSPVSMVSGEMFNAVAPEGNRRMIDVADLVAECIPGAVRGRPTSIVDRRSYRVSNEKFNHAFPTFRFHWSLRNGIKQLAESFKAAGMSAAEWRCDRFRRAARLQGLIEHGILDWELRTTASAAA